MQTVTVAWTENGKLMGKELKWNYIVKYNPNLKYLKPLKKDQRQLVDKLHTMAKLFENLGKKLDFIVEGCIYFYTFIQDGKPRAAELFYCKELKDCYAKKN